MHHIRTPRAAVAAEIQPAEAGTLRSQVPSSAPTAVLWASRPMTLQSGRAVAVRLVAGCVEVAFVAAGTSTLRWMPAERVMTERQALQWTRSCTFAASR